MKASGPGGRIGMPGKAVEKVVKETVIVEEVNSRTRSMAELAKKVALERNRQWIDWEGEILVDEVGKVSGTLIGRNFAYKPVVVRGSKRLLGKVLRVKVVKTCQTYLEGEVAE